ncbi:hypothetical protein OESDEN_14679, partial [Oesophagostomum dentatum]
MFQESNTTSSRLRDLPKDDQNFLRLARQSGDDPSCKNLKAEYDQVCFTLPPAQAFEETKAFCDAFVETCSETLKTNLFTHLTEIRVDFSEYCKQQKERFRYVCPKPLRFKTYAEQDNEDTLKQRNTDIGRNYMFTVRRTW